MSTEDEFHDFVAGFNQASFFDFVDVGTNKESVVSKVKGMCTLTLFDPYLEYVAQIRAPDLVLENTMAAIQQSTWLSPHCEWAVY